MDSRQTFFYSKNRKKSDFFHANLNKLINIFFMNLNKDFCALIDNLHYLLKEATGTGMLSY